MILFNNGSGPFRPNAAYSNANSYGDLANAGNLRYLRQYREETFQSDSAGFRNRKPVPKPFTGVLLLGDSFTAGSGVTDEQTLAEQLSDRTGVPVYNGAGSGPISPAEIMARLEMKSGLVILVKSERSPLGTPVNLAVHRTLWDRTPIRRVLGDSVRRRMVNLYGYVRSWRSYSPLKILFGRTVKWIQNDRLLPNPYRTHILKKQLETGQDILFLASEQRNYERDRPTDVAPFVKLKAQLEVEGNRFMVVLVPDKYVVYEEFFRSDSRHLQQHRPFVDALGERLALAGIPVVNLLKPLHNESQRLLRKSEYTYWLDDTHWNPAGIRIAASAIAASPEFTRWSGQR